MTNKKASPRPPRAGRAGLLALAVGLVAVPALVWALSSSGGEEPGQATFAEDPGVAHVHGLGVNPGDGSLLAA